MLRGRCYDLADTFGTVELSLVTAFWNQFRPLLLKVSFSCCDHGKFFF